MKVMGLEFFAFSADFRSAIDRYNYGGKANASDGTFSDLPCVLQLKRSNQFEDNYLQMCSSEWRG